MTEEPMTFIGWAADQFGELYDMDWTVYYSLRDPDNPDEILVVPETTRFDNGDYFMSDPKMFRAIELMGQQLKDIAEEKGVDLKQFSDLKAAFEYDLDPNEISGAELGSYVIGVFMFHRTLPNHYIPPMAPDMPTENTEGFYSELDKVEEVFSDDSIAAQGIRENIRGIQDLCEELGKQVYGDNSPETSSTDTKTEKSLERLKSLLPTPR